MGEKSTPLVAVLQVLRKYNLKDTEELLKKEANINDADLANIEIPDSELTNILSSHHSENDPYSYSFAYENLRRFIDGSLDIYKHELSTILYPVLVHMYLGLIIYDHIEHAKSLLEKYGPEQEDYYQDDLKKLSFVIKKDHMKGNEIAETFSSNKFVIQISRDTSSLLKRFIHEQKHSTIIANIVSNHLQLEVYEGGARGHAQLKATAGGLLGEAAKHENRVKVYYGLLKEDIQSLTVPVEEDEEMTEETPDKPKKKKTKKDPLFSKKTKSDPNAPPADRIPLPDLKESDKMEKVRAFREASKRVALGPENLPSICFYTLLNAAHAATCADICDDSSLLAVGFSNSTIKVWTLTRMKLKGMKSAEKLQDIDREAEDVLVRMMDDRDLDTCRTLYGHAGPVYRVGFDPYKTFLLSCSEDSTIRLWSLQCWTCLVVYRGHIWPVWDLRWSLHGHYFASGGHDRTARLWTTDHHQPVRIFAGHLSDVDVVQFHPNSNYIASGSSDRTVRLWDCLTGNQVRIMTGHKSTILALAFSVCGRWLASGGGGGGHDSAVLLWDLSSGSLAARLPNAHTAPMHSLAFSRDGTMLASGSLDCTLKLWDFTALAEEATNEENIANSGKVSSDDRFLLRSFGTMSAPIACLHFTRRNLLLAVGMYEGSS